MQIYLKLSLTCGEGVVRAVQRSLHEFVFGEMIEAAEGVSVRHSRARDRLAESLMFSLGLWHGLPAQMAQAPDTAWQEA